MIDFHLIWTVLSELEENDSKDAYVPTIMPQKNNCSEQTSPSNMLPASKYAFLSTYVDL